MSLCACTIVFWRCAEAGAIYLLYAPLSRHKKKKSRKWGMKMIEVIGTHLSNQSERPMVSGSVSKTQITGPLALPHKVPQGKEDNEYRAAIKQKCLSNHSNLPKNLFIWLFFTNLSNDHVCFLHAESYNIHVFAPKPTGSADMSAWIISPLLLTAVSSTPTGSFCTLNSTLQALVLTVFFAPTCWAGSIYFVFSDNYQQRSGRRWWCLDDLIISMLRSCI